jgi:peroxiredoxin
MVSLTTPPGRIGWNAAPFELPGTDGKRHTPATSRGPNGLVVMFICNHCPYVKAIVDKIARDARDLTAAGVGCIAVMSNDPTDHPEDSFANMQVVAARHGFGFPYVIDETQEVARAYGAVCTPDFFGFDRDLKLAYRGRLDASGRSPDPAAVRELYPAMLAVSRGEPPPQVQHPSIGCSIKWKEE